MVTRVAIIGAGSFGTALALHLADSGRTVTLIGRPGPTLDELLHTRSNDRYLPGVRLPGSVRVSADMSDARGQQLVLVVVPSHALRSVAVELRAHLDATAILAHATKGLEETTSDRMSTVLLREIPECDPRRIAVVSGPSHAEELARHLPTTLVVAAYAQSTAQAVQDALMSDTLRVYTNADVIGTELGGALKNIIALGCGISDGLKCGDNARAALMTRGLVEISRLGAKLGAAKLTFSGLTGVGDLIVTCTSRHSRNWRAGYLLGQGRSLDAALAEVGMVVEGVRTTSAAVHLAAQHGVHMPIADVIADILFHGKAAAAGAAELMRRDRTHEVEEYAEDIAVGWRWP